MLLMSGIAILFPQLVKGNAIFDLFLAYFPILGYEASRPLVVSTVLSF